MKYLITILLVCVGLVTKAQEYWKDLDGSPIKYTKNIEIEGSPYLLDKYLKGTLTFSDKSFHNNLYLKYDVYNNAILFKKTLDEPNELELKSLPNQFAIEEKGKTRIFVNGANYKSPAFTKTFLEALSYGKVNLLKHYEKRITDSREYNSAITVKGFELLSKLYATNEHKEVILLNSANKTQLMELFKTDTEKVSKFISDKKLSLKSEKDLIQLFDYYNSL